MTTIATTTLTSAGTYRQERAADVYVRNGDHIALLLQTEQKVEMEA